VSSSGVFLKLGDVRRSRLLARSEEAIPRPPRVPVIHPELVLNRPRARFTTKGMVLAGVIGVALGAVAAVFAGIL
jgi:hypothetical protein